MGDEPLWRQEPWMSIGWKLLDLARIIAEAKYGFGRPGTFPENPESLLRRIPDGMRIDEYLRALGDELVDATRETDVVPKSVVGTAWWFFAELMALPESTQGRDRAIELAWIWREKLDEAFGGVSITG